jgi:hypothetical protein
MAGIFKFTFGPWNIHEGADPFGPEVREIFLKLLDISRKLDENIILNCQKERVYEQLDLYIMKSLLGG